MNYLLMKLESQLENFGVCEDTWEFLDSSSGFK